MIVCVCFFIIPSEVLKRALTQVSPKQYLPNFPTPKNPGFRNFKPKKLFNHDPALEIQSTPPGSTYQPDIIAGENHAYGPSMVTSNQITGLLSLFQLEDWIVGYLTSCDINTNTLHLLTRLIFNTNKIWETFSPCGHGPARTPWS